MHTGEKICPSCHCEYRATAERCADCNVALVHPEELEAASELPPASQLVPIRIASMTWCRAFSDWLSERGVPHRIDAPPESGEVAEALKKRSHDHSLAIYVLPSDRERAIAIDAEFVRVQIPDLPAEAAGDPEDEGACPACGDAVSASASECPGCGLFLGEPD